jgi:hypothetical protein
LKAPDSRRFATAGAAFSAIGTAAKPGDGAPDIQSTKTTKSTFAGRRQRMIATGNSPKKTAPEAGGGSLGTG